MTKKKKKKDTLIYPHEHVPDHKILKWFHTVAYIRWDRGVGGFNHPQNQRKNVILIYLIEN